MSLLQELKRDSKTLLNTTGATREQLETFLNISGITLGEILYFKNKYNLFVDWLKHQEALNKNLLLVNVSMIEYLVDKYDKGQQYTTSEKIDCYAYDKATNTFIACVNSNGDCFIYEYNNIKELKLDLIY